MLALIREFSQLTNYDFQIVWSDGVVSSFRLSDLQKKCPCARCQEQKEDRKLELDVRARKISSVGNYALRIDFTEGCNRGIFTFHFLRNF
ncbi:MAG: DUF971 domain-containing protein [Rhabdochlamydiaceae bacterium]|nr:DUF971 domain-containing protein [Rhabdochlamydiaceae bacterium]